MAFVAAFGCRAWWPDCLRVISAYSHSGVGAVVCKNRKEFQTHCVPKRLAWHVHHGEGQGECGYFAVPQVLKPHKPWRR